MKKFILIAFFTSIMVPAFAADFAVPEVESVKSFTRPDMSRFQYSLPEHANFTPFKKKSAVVEITLDEDEIKPVRKVIKRIDSNSKPQQFNPDDVKDQPMNYDNFPKFYNPNDLMNQQFMPSAMF